MSLESAIDPFIPGDNLGFIRILLHNNSLIFIFGCHLGDSRIIVYSDIHSSGLLCSNIDQSRSN
jgi:hypothetical protein